MRIGVFTIIKLFLISIVSVIFLFASKNVAAQDRKFGSFNLDTVISLMPGIGRVDTLLAVYEKDSLGQQYQALVNQLRIHDSLIMICDFHVNSKLVEEEKAALNKCTYLLQNWLSYSQQQIQAKQKELMRPFYTKALDAYQEVVKEGNYDYVFKGNTFSQVPPSNNLTISVLKSLGINVPDELQLQGQASAKAATFGRKQ